MKNKYQLMLFGVVALFIFFAIYFQYSGWKECSDKGGVYLRAAFGYECIDARSAR